VTWFEDLNHIATTAGRALSPLTIMPDFRAHAQCRVAPGKPLVSAEDSYEGILVSDCLSAYEHIPCRRQKCYAHHLKAIARAAEEQPSSAFLAEARILLQSALAVHSLRDRVSEDKYVDLIGRLEIWAPRPAAQVDHAKIAKRLCKRRRYLFTFLRHQTVDATNNAAERTPRPAVVARQISCGNRTERGKNVWSLRASPRRAPSSSAPLPGWVEQVVPVATPAPSEDCQHHRPTTS
jgi:hypothetical protein